MSDYKKIKNRTYEIMEVAKHGDKASLCFDIFIIVFILLNVFAIILESVRSIRDVYSVFFYTFEVISVGVFSVEYVLRVWSSTSSLEYGSPMYGRIKFIFTPLLLIDLLAILPFYMAILGMDLRYLRLLRVFRIFRLAKLARYSKALRLFGKVLNKRKAELAVTMMLMFVLLIVVSALMYFAERDAQPEIFSSIPASMWWGVATLSTVGYGDVYPITLMGKIMASFMAVIGIGFFGLPAGILGSAFMEELASNGNQNNTCPHCGKEI